MKMYVNFQKVNNLPIKNDCKPTKEEIGKEKYPHKKYKTNTKTFEF